MRTTNRDLPKALTAAIQSLAELGPLTQALGRRAVERLWFDASKHLPGGRIFLSTGDIPAMWIRDSTWQVRPLLRFITDRKVDSFIHSIIQTQAFYLSIDPYANAFNPEPNDNCWEKDFPDQSPWVFERKFELDSITGFWQLSLDYLAAKGDSKVLDRSWWVLTKRLVELLWSETEHDPYSYRFFRPNNPAHDSLANEGLGADYESCGLIWSGFRPSDDACELPFLIPSNIHAMVLLRRLSALSSTERPELAMSCFRLADKLQAAIRDYAICKVDGQTILAYEVDGKGGVTLMDDANYPNLISLGYLGYEELELVNSSRAFSLSSRNPWFFSGKFASGLGSPHTGKNQVWPLALAMAGLTSSTLAEKLDYLRTIEQTIANDAIHESFNVEDPTRFTREWFNWAEMTYLELAFQVLEAQEKK